MNVNAIMLLPVLICLVQACTDRDNASSQYDDSYLSTVQYLKYHRPLDDGKVVDLQGLIMYEGLIVTNQKQVDRNKSSIVAYDSGNLESLWEWTDAFDEYGIEGFKDGGRSLRQYLTSSKLVTYDRNILYLIDMQLGSTDQKFVFSDNLLGLDGVGEIAPTTQTESELDERIGYVNVTTGVYTEVDRHTAAPPYRANVNTPSIFLHEGRSLLTYVTVTWLAGDPIESYWLNLYDIDRGEKVWKSDSIPVVLPGGNMGNRIRYSNGKLILANNMIYAYNVEDGSLAWSRDYGNSFILSSHPIVAEGRVYANNDSGFMVCLDVRTGLEIWRTETGGSPSPIVYHDGRIYMSNVTQPGGNSLLVIDADSGEILYDVVAPYDPDVDPSPLFNDAIAVDPETGYVYTGNYRDLLVYEFP